MTPFAYAFWPTSQKQSHPIIIPTVRQDKAARIATTHRQ